MTVRLLLAAVLGWLAVAVLVLALCRAAACARPTFDEHTRTALAALQPDHTDLPAAPPLSYIEQVEAYVAAHAPKES